MTTRSAAIPTSSVLLDTRLAAASGQALLNPAMAALEEAVIVVTERLETPVDLPQLQLPLTAEQRTVLRGRRRTSCGRDVLLQLPRDLALQPGDQLVDALQSCLVIVRAEPEALLRVQAPSTLSLLQAAYHLGNRHVALELHERELFLPDDPVLAAMLEGRGLQVSHCKRPFAPERGAYDRHSHQ